MAMKYGKGKKGTASHMGGFSTRPSRSGKGVPRTTGKVKHGPSGSQPLPRWYGSSAK